MDVRHDFIRALLDPLVKESVEKMFQPGFKYNGFTDRMPIDLYDVSFRLSRPTETYINFEFLAKSQSGRYFNPIALFDNNLNIILLNEFYDSYKNISSQNENDCNVQFLDIKLNAVIAAFSMSAVELANEILLDINKNGFVPELRDGIMIPPTLRFDKRLESNGLLCELLLTEYGYPQFFLDDKYELEGPIGAYFYGDDLKLKIHPIKEYKELFDYLNELDLLTAFNKI